MAAKHKARNLRSALSARRRRYDSEDELLLDLSKDPSENVREVLSHVIRRHNVTDKQKVGYLNSFVKLLNKVDPRANLGFSLEEIMCCLRVSLFHEAQKIRAAGLRAIRHLVKTEVDVDVLLTLHLHLLIVRSLDVEMDNEMEKVQALRLLRKVLAVSPAKFPGAFTNCLVALVNGGQQETDKTFMACLATLNEVAILNTESCLQAGGVGAILSQMPNCQTSTNRILESLIGTILYLLNNPKTRIYIRPKVDLEQILCPFTDGHGQARDDISDTIRKQRFEVGMSAVVSTLRSWPGMIWLCQPGNDGIQTLVNLLYLPYSDVRQHLMQIIYDLFRFRVPTGADSFTKGVRLSDPSLMQDSWKLIEGFVAEEGKSLLPYIGKYRPNLVENYLSLLLLAFINAGLLEGLIEVITNCTNIDYTYEDIMATILLGQLLNLANTRLPYECSHNIHCLPTLLSIAASFDNPLKQRRARTVVNVLNRLHSIKKRGVVPCSLFLDQLVQFSPQLRHSTSEIKLPQIAKKDSDELVSQAIKDTFVLSAAEPIWYPQTKENGEIKDERKERTDNEEEIPELGTVWLWSIIGDLFKWPGDCLRKLEDSPHKQYIRKILHFFKPTSKLFSCLEQSHKEAKLISTVGCHFMDFLAEQEEHSEGMKILDEFLVDIGLCLSQIVSDTSSTGKLFSAPKMLTTMCMNYFLFVGRLSHTRRGQKALEKSGVFQNYIDLVSTTSHDCYLKLIISSLDYTQDGIARVVLNRVLTATHESARLYATNFLRVLLRLRLNDFRKWGIELLVSQLYDRTQSVTVAALSVLDEACDDKSNLEALISLRPSLLHLGERGHLLLARFLSVPSGFKFLTDANYIPHEMDTWQKGFNLKYVKIVEDGLNEALTSHQRGDDGCYLRRSTSTVYTSPPVHDVYVPPHLYGQLVQHSAGLDLLLTTNMMGRLVQTVQLQEIQTDEQTLHLKAALWALGHIGTSDAGVNLLNEEQVIQDIVKLAEECQIFSIRGTCFNVLGLLASTATGVELLSQLGWMSVRHQRTEQWPITMVSSVQVDALVRGADGENSPDYKVNGEMTRGNSQASTDEWNGDQMARFEVGGESFSCPSDRDENLATVLQYQRGQRLLRPGRSFDENGCNTQVGNTIAAGLSLSEKSRTLPHPSRKKSVFMDVDGLGIGETLVSSDCGYQSGQHHKRSVSLRHNGIEPTPNTNTNTYVIGSVTSSPRSAWSRPRLKVGRARERIRSRSFTDATPTSPASGFGIQSSVGGKVRSISNMEIAPFQQLRSNCDVSGIGDKKDERSDSNESSNASTSKSRSDSYTDSTSGVGSFDSGAGRLGTVEQGPSSIVMATSLSTTQLGGGSGNAVPATAVHASDSVRKLVNLRHTAVVLRRVPSVPRGQISPDVQPDTSFVYTTTEDAAGYAALRTIQRRRGIVSVDISDPNCPVHVSAQEFRAMKTRSLESGRDPASIRLFGEYLQFNAEGRMQDQHMPTRSLSSHSIRTGSDAEVVRHMGLCLPIDTSMIFSVDFREERRLSGLSRIDEQLSEVNPTVDLIDHGGDPNMIANSQDNHSPSSCIKCSRLPRSRANTGRSRSSTGTHVSDNSGSSHDSLIRPRVDSPVAVRNLCFRPHANSSGTSVSAANTPHSLSSSGSLGADSRPLLNFQEGNQDVWIRNQVMGNIINVATYQYIGVKMRTKNLLCLKARCPAAFEDICLYSDIMNHMSENPYAMHVRRFVQELFLDMKFKELYEEPLRILQVTDPEHVINIISQEPRIAKVDQEHSITNIDQEPSIASTGEDSTRES